MISIILGHIFNIPKILETYPRIFVVEAVVFWDDYFLVVGRCLLLILLMLGTDAYVRY